MRTILLLDNYDSFTYNIKELILRTIWEIKSPHKILIYKNDDIKITRFHLDSEDLLIAGPGPGGPEDTAYGYDLVKNNPNIRTLGICLGHQLLAHIHGANISKASNPLHGKCSRIFHDTQGIYRNIKNGILFARYHSLAISKSDLPSCISVTALSDDNEIMSIKVKDTRQIGIQYHPESFMSMYGQKIIKNFILQ